MYFYVSFKNSSKKIFVLICYKDACGRLGECSQHFLISLLIRVSVEQDCVLEISIM